MAHFHGSVSGKHVHGDGSYLSGPSIGTITATTTSITFTHANGATHYRIYLLGGSPGVWVSIPASPVTVSGLTVNTEYTLQVSGDGSTASDTRNTGTTNPGTGGGEIDTSTPETWPSIVTGPSIWEGLVKRFRAPTLPKPGVLYAQAYMDNLVNILRLYFNQLDDYIGNVSKFAASGTAAPTTGVWAKGDVLRNNDPVELGTAGARYVITGWICVASGSPGTWREMRSLTGN